MSDLVVTCPSGFWKEWIAESDPAGAEWSGTEWGWYMNINHRPPIEIGDRLYIVARGLLRGYAPVTAVRGLSFDPTHGARDGAGVYVDADPRVWCDGQLVPGAEAWCVCRRSDAVAVTVADPIRGFQGYRRRWWSREVEKPFPNWQTADGWVAA